MRPDVLVVGAGTAGLAAATSLAEAGARVVVLEARPTAGGRARSWRDPETGHVEDNGQHVVLGCYDAFLAFASRIGAEGEIAFSDRLALALLGGPRAARIGLPRRGLSALLADPSNRFLVARGGELRTGAPVVGLETDGGGRRVLVARTRDGTRHEAGAFVVAVPPRAAAAILPSGCASFGDADASRFASSPIVAVHLWLDRVVLDLPLAGFLDSPIHWAFDRGAREGGPERGYVALVSSAAAALARLPREEVARIAIDELRRFLPRARDAAVRKVRVLKEREATPSFGPREAPLRPGTRTRIANLLLAGDWIDVGLPATLEAAAESGHRAAAALRG